ncbi:hypothetical protein C8Q75DRAFT_767588 [Abortiporus biennis]|nr:hypothetical protein C8Q75DRAFT_767588 [Abortiporus biennis]
MSQGSKFPVEIFSLILNDPSIENETLLQCSLVSKNWSECCQPRLFHNIVVKIPEGEDRTSPFFAFLQNFPSTPKIRGYVQSLSFQNWNYPFEEDRWAESDDEPKAWQAEVDVSFFAKVLENFPQLNTLDLRWVTLLTSNTTADLVATAAKRDLKMLSIRDVHVRGDLSSLAHFLRLFSSIERLKMHHLAWWSWVTWNDQLTDSQLSKIPSDLRITAAEISTEQYEEIPVAPNSIKTSLKVLTHVHIPTLTSLDIRFGLMHLESVPEFVEFMVKVGGNLKHLGLDEYTMQLAGDEDEYYGGTYTEFWDSLDLTTACSSLESFAVTLGMESRRDSGNDQDDLDYTENSPWKFLEIILHSVPKTISEMTWKLQLEPIYNDDEGTFLGPEEIWDGINSALDSFENLEHLRIVSSYVDGGRLGGPRLLTDSEKVRVRERLPSADSRSLLEFTEVISPRYELRP